MVQYTCDLVIESHTELRSHLARHFRFPENCLVYLDDLDDRLCQERFGTPAAALLHLEVNHGLVGQETGESDIQLARVCARCESFLVGRSSVDGHTCGPP